MFIQITAGFVQITAGFVQITAGFVQITAGFVKLQLGLYKLQLGLVSELLQRRSTQSGRSGHGQASLKKVDHPGSFKSRVVFDYRLCICYA